MAMETMAVAKVIGTYKILERWVGSINAGRMPTPSFLVRSYRREVELPRRAG
jgi:hypothetical protein